MFLNLMLLIYYLSHLTVTGLLRFAVDVTAICCVPPFSGKVTWDRANPIPATTKYFNNINVCWSHDKIVLLFIAVYSRILIGWEATMNFSYFAGGVSRWQIIIFFFMCSRHQRQIRDLFVMCSRHQSYLSTFKTYRVYVWLEFYCLF